MVDGNGGIAGFSGDCRLCWFHYTLSFFFFFFGDWKRQKSQTIINANCKDTFLVLKPKMYGISVQ